MAPRIGFSLESLRKMDPAACDTDARLVWRSGDEMNIGIVQPRYRGTADGWGNYFIQNLSPCGPRELRLLGLQMIAHADELERDSNPHEVVLP